MGLSPYWSGIKLPYIAAMLCLAYFGGYILWKVFIYPLCLSPLRHLPSPKHPHFLAGNGYAVLGKPPGAELLRWTETIPNDGLIRFRGYLNQDHLLITTPSTLADVLQRHCYDFEKPLRLRRFLGRIQGDGLSVVEGEQHKFQRKNLNPAFHVRHIKDLYPLFWSKSQKLVETLASACGGLTGAPQAVEMGEYASRASMDIIGIAALGRDLNTLDDPQHPVMEQFVKLFEISPQNMVYFGASLIFPRFLVDRLPMFRKAKTTLENGSRILRDEARAMVRAKKQGTLGADILSVILRADGFDEDNLVDQLVTFLAAGHETTANALTWTAYLLAMHPDVQARLREELSLAGEIPSGTDGIASKLDSLPILHGVICEALRLFPGAPILLREAVRDTSIEGHHVPKGTQIILCPWAMNRNTAFWGPDANEFKPERWSDITPEGLVKTNNHGGAGSNYSFLTFLQGPRRCIGENFTRAELRCLIASIIGAFELKMFPGRELVTPSGVVGLKPLEGVWLQLTAIQAALPERA